LVERLMQIESSRETALVMQDTTPAQIGTAGTPNVVAAPTRSLWQSDCIATRCKLRVAYAMRACDCLGAKCSVGKRMITEEMRALFEECDAEAREANALLDRVRQRRAQQEAEAAMVYKSHAPPPQPAQPPLDLETVAMAFALERENWRAHVASELQKLEDKLRAEFERAAKNCQFTGAQACRLILAARVRFSISFTQSRLRVLSRHQQSRCSAQPFFCWRARFQMRTGPRSACCCTS
jgi:hypothetical protein